MCIIIESDDFSSSKEPCELLAADRSDVTEIQAELA